MKCLFILFICFISGALADNECTKNNDCLVESSICVNKTCTCPADFVFNSERTECLKVSHGYGTACSDSLQCSTSLLSGGMCNNGTCKCSEGYHYFKGQCWKSAGLDDSCAQNDNCFVSHDFEASNCNEQKVCECATGYYQREYSSCRRISKNPGDPCGISLDCKFENAVCTMNRTCDLQSKEEEEEENEEEREDNENQSSNIKELCRKKRTIFTNIASLGSNKIGGDCKKDADCPTNAHCYMESICLCLKGYYTTDNSTCLPELGGTCKTDDDCQGKNTMCRDGQYCTCKEGFVASPASINCEKMSRKLGWSCLTDEECGFFGPGGKCISKKCHCSNETHWVEDQFYCWVTMKVGETCKQLEDCGGQNSSMTCSDQKKCTCIAGTHASSSGKKCNKDSTQVGGPCDENIDCIYEHSQCNTTLNRCTCERGYLENKTICIPGINGTCKADGDCSVKKSHCYNNTCICDGDNVPSKKLDKCLPLATTIGVQCEESDQCSSLVGDCINGSCLCQNGSTFFSTYQKCFVSAQIGQYCRQSQNCTARHSWCLNNICRCVRGYRPRGNTCVSSGHIEFSSDFMTFASTVMQLIYLIYFL